MNLGCFGNKVIPSLLLKSPFKRWQVIFTCTPTSYRWEAHAKTDDMEAKEYAPPDRYAKQLSQPHKSQLNSQRINLWRNKRCYYKISECSPRFWKGWMEIIWLCPSFSSTLVLHRQSLAGTRWFQMGIIKISQWNYPS